MQTPLDAGPPWMQTLLNADPLDADPLDADPLDVDPLHANPTGCGSPLDAHLPGYRPSWMQTPSHVTSDACWEASPHCGQTNTCENTTLP